jgi:hypothetical protein
MPPRVSSGRKRNPPNREARKQSVFLNIPYDDAFENLFLAYIAGISAFGLIPRAAIEIPFGPQRLDRILSLMRESDYSLHDLSRVQLDRNRPRTPRFNMPFELGLAVALQRGTLSHHAWVVCESQRDRLEKSISDLKGSDAYIHDGTIRGLFRELGNIFVRGLRQPTVDEMMRIYRVLRANFAGTLRRAGASSPFNARVFRDLCVLASAAADELFGV